MCWSGVASCLAAEPQAAGRSRRCRVNRVEGPRAMAEQEDLERSPHPRRGACVDVCRGRGWMHRAAKLAS